MADFDLLKVKVIDRYISFLEKGLTLTKRRRLTYCASKSGLLLGLSLGLSFYLVQFSIYSNSNFLGFELDL